MQWSKYPRSIQEANLYNWFEYVCYNRWALIQCLSKTCWKGFFRNLFIWIVNESKYNRYEKRRLDWLHAHVRKYLKYFMGQIVTFQLDNPKYALDNHSEKSIVLTKSMTEGEEHFQTEWTNCFIFCGKLTYFPHIFGTEDTFWDFFHF